MSQEGLTLEQILAALVALPEREQDKAALSLLTHKRRPLAPHPTPHLPGTEAKILVMTWRASNGFEVFHPLDAKVGDERPLLQPVKPPHNARRKPPSPAAGESGTDGEAETETDD
jgi:hypothetical protein